MTVRKGRKAMAAIRSTARNLVLFFLCAAQLTILLDTSIVHVALPAIQADIHIPTHQLQWVAAAYALSFGGFLLLGGRMGDLFGRRRMLMAGMALFTAASAAGGLASEIGLLIAARALQGLGAAFIAPAVLSLLTMVFSEGEERNRALGVLGTVSAAGFTVGLILGGILTGALGWRWVFYVNIPIGILVIALAPRLLPESERLRKTVDVPGSVVGTAGITLLVYACTTAGTSGLFSVRTWSFFLLALFLLLAFLFIESRIGNPLIPLEIFRNRTFVGALMAGGVFGSVMGPTIFMLTLYLQNVLGFGPLATGFAFLPQEITVLVAANLIGRYVSRIGVKAVLTGGILGFGAGALMLARISAEGSYWNTVLPGMMLIGLGVSCVIVAGAIAATAGMAPEEQGLASGLWNTAPQIGAALGLAVLVTVANAFSDDALRHEPGLSTPVSVGWVFGFKAAFIASIGFVAVGLWSVLALIRKTNPFEKTKHDD